jgi:hypothetical protein
MKARKDFRLKTLIDRVSFCEYLLSIPEADEINISIFDPVMLRTRKQNRYYRFLLSLISEHSGHDMEYLHDFFSKKFISSDIESVLITEKKESRLLSINEFNEFIECVTNFAINDLGMKMDKLNNTQSGN